jgi:hypothetical protein
MAFYRLGNAVPKLLHSCRLGAHAHTFLVTRLFPFVSNRLSARTGLHLHLQPEWRFLPLLTPASQRLSHLDPNKPRAARV